MDDYVARIRRYAEIEVRELRPDSAASLKRLDIGAGGTVVLLDAGGKQFSSEQFAEWIGSCRDRGQRELVFLCGAAEGFPQAIYRAFALLSGHPYPK